MGSRNSRARDQEGGSSSREIARRTPEPPLILRRRAFPPVRHAGPTDDRTASGRESGPDPAHRRPTATPGTPRHSTALYRTFSGRAACADPVGTSTPGADFERQPSHACEPSRRLQRHRGGSLRPSFRGHPRDDERSTNHHPGHDRARGSRHQNGDLGDRCVPGPRRPEPASNGRRPGEDRQGPPSARAAINRFAIVPLSPVAVAWRPPPWPG